MERARGRGVREVAREKRTMDMGEVGRMSEDQKPVSEGSINESGRWQAHGSERPTVSKPKERRDRVDLGADEVSVSLGRSGPSYTLTVCLMVLERACLRSEERSERSAMLSAPSNRLLSLGGQSHAPRSPTAFCKAASAQRRARKKHALPLGTTTRLSAAF